MPGSDLDGKGIEGVLAGQAIVRVAFRDGEERYLLPLGYVWLRGAMHGVSGPGRKLRLAAADPRVTFQVDTSAESGWFAWESVTGEGRFEIVSDELIRRETFAAWRTTIEGAPAWWREEIGPAVDAGALAVWRLTPIRVTGRRFGRGEDARGSS